MAVENITGADAVPRGVIENSNKYTREVATEEKETIPEQMLKEEKKGLIFDTYV